MIGQEMGKMVQDDSAMRTDGYKMTELGPLPEEWQVVPGHEIFVKSDKRVGNSLANPPRILSITRYEGLVPQSKRFYKNVASQDVRNYKLVYKHQVVYGFPVDEAVFAVYFGDVVGAVSPVYCVWDVVHRGIDYHYLDLLMKQPFMIAQYTKYASNVVERRRTLKPADFLKVLFPLPPLPEQRAIAHVLRTVQQAKETRERVAAALKQLKKSLMQHLFTYGPVPVGAQVLAPLQETEIGTLPAHWQVVRLGEVANIITGKTPPTSEHACWNGRIPFITPADLKGSPIRFAQRSITEAGLKYAKPLQKGTVLVSCIGYIGKVGVVDVDVAVTNQQINAAIPLSVDSWFLAYALMQETEILNSRARMTTVPILHKSNFERIPIPLPPLPEQREIARILRTVDQRIEAEEASVRALETLFKTLLHELMTAKRRLPRELVMHFQQEETDGSV